MGGSSSLPLSTIKLTEKECQSITKQLFDKKTFDAFADSDHMVSLEQLRMVYEQKTDVFLTHDWGKELGMDNHERVARVNEAMKKRGLRTWFDAEKMEGNVKKKMISGIENSYCMVVFITQRYMEKVDSDNAEDNCQLEFNYASRRKTARKMVPVVMEGRMRDTSAWVGEVGMVLGGSLYVDLSSDDSFEARMDELYGRVLGVTGTTVEEVVSSEMWKELIERKLSTAPAASAAPATPAAPSQSPAPAVAVHHGDDQHLEPLQQEMHTWMEANTKIVRKFVTKYVLMLSDAGVGSIEKLNKKLIRNANYLHELGLDEDDADELVMAVMASGKGGAASAAAAVPASKLEDVDCKECADLYYASRLLSKAGKERLVQIANNAADEPHSMVAKGMLAVCYDRGGGSYEVDKRTAAQYGAACFAYLKANCFQPYDYAVSPSDIVQKPYSLGSVGAWVVGNLLKDAVGVTQDTSLGFRFMEVSSLHDFMLAHNTLGIMVENGVGTRSDKKRAFQLFRLAAEKKFAVALYNVGHNYLNGDMVQKDTKEAMRLYWEAANAGYSEALAWIGILYCDGRATGKKDMTEGSKILKQAAALGSKRAAEFMNEYRIH